MLLTESIARVLIDFAHFPSEALFAGALNTVLQLVFSFISGDNAPQSHCGDRCIGHRCGTDSGHTRPRLSRTSFLFLGTHAFSRWFFRYQRKLQPNFSFLAKKTSAWLGSCVPKTHEARKSNRIQVESSKIIYLLHLAKYRGQGRVCRANRLNPSSGHFWPRYWVLQRSSAPGRVFFQL